jgi:parvulin-like peptidyl-prolyl isomerase
MKAIVREPLLHFLALGAVLFLYYEWKGGASGPGSSRIVITEGIVGNLVAGFTRTWHRAPTHEELKALVDEHVKEEIATREAVAMGLDRDDTVIRRRLRQKLEFLVEDEDGQIAPSDAELQRWLEAHPDVIQSEPRVALRQVFVNTQTRGPGARAEARRLLARLRAAGVNGTGDALGDSSMLPRDLPLGPVSEVSRTFGDKFAAAVENLEPGQWSGPVESAYGLHIVLVMDRVVAQRPALSDVRPLVVREVLADRQRTQLRELYQGLLAKYTVTIETQVEDPKPAKTTRAEGGMR